jgi:hypothetical protein
MRPAVDDNAKPIEGGSRVAIVHNGSPLFSGGPGSGLSEIRRHVVENDLLEAIVALPEQLFYNTGIASYVWVLTNRKSAERRGKVQLVDARDLWVRMRKSLGEKRREISPEQVDEITALHGAFTDGDRVKILPNDFFAYRRVTVDRPLRGRWEIDAHTWTLADADGGPLAKLDDADRASVADALRATPAATFDDETATKAAFKAALKPALGKVGAPLLNALAAACFVRDPTPPCLPMARVSRCPTRSCATSRRSRGPRMSAPIWSVKFCLGRTTPMSPIRRAGRATRSRSLGSFTSLSNRGRATRSRPRSANLKPSCARRSRRYWRDLPERACLGARYV